MRGLTLVTAALAVLLSLSSARAEDPDPLAGVDQIVVEIEDCLDKALAATDPAVDVRPAYKICVGPVFKQCLFLFWQTSDDCNGKHLLAWRKIGRDMLARNLLVTINHGDRRALPPSALSQTISDFLDDEKTFRDLCGLAASLGSPPAVEETASSSQRDLACLVNSAMTVAILEHDRLRAQQVSLWKSCQKAGQGDCASLLTVTW